ncbi:nucleotidyltransferase domain-containing protein [Synechococcus sp. Cruz-9H2]|uniref:nucleotidyltransferase family protein n=1 Tax=Synechococcus sp. Cruz-7B9 TaxID=2823729 RepID=UPI0020D06874|nr:nucleotidyltransferase domain-containing protein [Synechococcus sp. Cruz-7B9]MCP9820347.1 nucleotidyltransferase domain-containing protein [Synechococcus sp. Cruz-9H2]
MEASQKLLGVLAACPAVEEVWLYGSRAMGRHRPASRDLLRLMEAIDDLPLPWQVDLSLEAHLNEDLRAHVERVGLCLLSRGSMRNPDTRRRAADQK